MNYISEVGEGIMFKLVSWELLGRDDHDPKRLLRALPLPDLVTAVKNTRALRNQGEFLSVNLVKAEMMYRMGHLKDDWSVDRNKGLHYVIDPQFINSLSPQWAGATA